MVYKEHEAWRDEVGLDSAVFDLCDVSEDQAEFYYEDDHRYEATISVKWGDK